MVGLHALQHVTNICDGRPPFSPPSPEDQYVGYCEGEGPGADRFAGLGTNPQPEPYNPITLTL